MFRHELMKPMLQKNLSNLVETKHNDLLVEAIKSKISTHITSSYTIKHNLAREFMGTLVTTTLVFSKDASAKMVAKNLGLSRKCVYQNLQ
jgi:predicted transcriptional regulator YheO